jgi:hypothetical protein
LSLHLKFASLFQVLDIRVYAANLSRDIDVLRAVVVALFTAYAVVGLTLFLNGTVITYEECSASLAVVFIT